MLLSWVVAAALAAPALVAEGSAEVPVYVGKRDAGPPTKSQLEQLERGRQRALADATRAAVLNAVASSSTSAVAGSLLAEDLLYNDVSRFVTKTETLSSEDTDRLVKVTVRATLDGEAITRSLNDIQRQMKLLGQRKVMLAIDEKSVEESGEVAEISTRGMSTALAAMFRRDGWIILDGFGRFTSSRPTREDIERVAVELGADEILTGTVTMTRLKPRSGSMLPQISPSGEQLMFVVSGEYALTLVDTGSWFKRATVNGTLDQKSLNQVQTGKSYASTELDFARVGSPALVRAFREKMLAMLTDMEANGLEVTVEVADADFDAAVKMEGRIKKLPNVKSVQAREYEDRKQIFEVRYSGTAANLAKAIGGLKGSKFDVTTVRTAFIRLSGRP